MIELTQQRLLNLALAQLLVEKAAVDEELTKIKAELGSVSPDGPWVFGDGSKINPGVRVLFVTAANAMRPALRSYVGQIGEVIEVRAGRLRRSRHERLALVQFRERGARFWIRFFRLQTST